MTFFAAVFALWASGSFLAGSGSAQVMPDQNRTVEAMYISSKMLGKNGRPANLYLPSLYTPDAYNPGNEKFCNTILDALNQPWPVPKDFYKYSGPLFYSEVLTDNKFSVRWNQMLGAPYKSSKELSKTIIDIDNDGDKDIVFRSAVSPGGYHGIKFQYLFASDQVDHFEKFIGEVIDYEQIWKLEQPLFYIGYRQISHKIDMSFTWGYQPAKRKQHEKRFDAQYMNVLVINNVSYILWGGSNDITLPNNPEPIRIYKPRSYWSHEFLCEFKFNPEMLEKISTSPEQ
jgi:hypothetical protein